MKEIHGIDLSSLQIIKLKSVNFSSKTDSLSMEVTNHSFSGIQRIEVILTKKRPIIEFEPINKLNSGNSTTHIDATHAFS